MDDMYISPESALADAVRFEHLLAQEVLECRLCALSVSPYVIGQFTKMHYFEFVEWASTAHGLGLSLVPAKRLAYLVQLRVRNDYTFF
jgi:hypothetical protein